MTDIPQYDANNTPSTWLRRLTRWIASWAESRYGSVMLMTVSFTESSFFLIPPDTLLLPLCLSKPDKAYRFALECTAASVIGGIFGYALGAYFFAPVCQPIIEFYQMQDTVGYVQELYYKYNAYIVFIAGFSPIPYKAFTILGGFSKINFAVFCLASLLSRGARFYLEAWFCRRYGSQSIDWIERNMIRISWVVTGMIVMGLAVWWLWQR